MPAIIVMLWLTMLPSNGYSQSQYKPAGSESHIFVYALSEQQLLIYRVKRNGALQRILQDNVEIGQFPRSLAVSPNGHTLYVGSDSQPNTIHPGLIYEFTIQNNGCLKPLGAIDAGYLPVCSTPDPSGGYLYCAAMDGVTNQGLIYQYRIKADGSLVALTPKLLNIGTNIPHTLIMHFSGKYLYALTMGNSLCFRINSNGTLSRLSNTLNLSHSIIDGMAIDATGQYAYLVQRNLVIASAKIDSRTGELIHPRPVAHLLHQTNGYVSIAINPQRHSLYIANLEDRTISQFSVVSGGFLRPLVPSIFGNKAAYRRLAIYPTGQYTYSTIFQVTTPPPFVSSQDLGKIVQFHVNSDGTLAAMQPDFVPAEDSTNAIVIVKVVASGRIAARAF